MKGLARVRLFHGGCADVQRQVASEWPGAEVCVTGGGGDFDAALVWEAEPAEIATFAEHQARRWWLHTRSSGLPGEVIAGLRGQDVLVTNGVGTHGIAVAEHVAAVLLAHYKRLPTILEAQRERVWRVPESIDEVGRKVAGVVGTGDLGQSIAKVLTGLGATVRGLRGDARGDFGQGPWGGPRERAGAAPGRGGQTYAGWRRASAGESLAAARVYGAGDLTAFLDGLDILILAAPLTDRTCGMIGAAELALLAPGAVVINVGRGPIVCEQALVSAMESGHLSGAALDVFADEPLPASSRLWSLPNVIISPHCADSTPQTDQRSLSLLVENIHRFRAGQPLRNVVDLARGY